GVEGQSPDRAADLECTFERPSVEKGEHVVERPDVSCRRVRPTHRLRPRYLQNGFRNQSRQHVPRLPALALPHDEPEGGVADGALLAFVQRPKAGRSEEALYRLVRSADARPLPLFDTIRLPKRKIANEERQAARGDETHRIVEGEAGFLQPAHDDPAEILGRLR